MGGLDAHGHDLADQPLGSLDMDGLKVGAAAGKLARMAAGARLEPGTEA